MRESKVEMELGLVKKTAEKIVETLNSLGILGLKTKGLVSINSKKEITALMIAPNRERNQIKVIVIDDVSTLGSVEYDQGKWLKLPKKIAELPPETQHKVLRTIIQLAASTLKFNKNNRSIPISLLRHPNDTAHEIIAFVSAKQEFTNAVITGLNAKTYSAESLVFFDDEIRVISLQRANFGKIKTRFNWKKIVEINTERISISTGKNVYTLNWNESETGSVDISEMKNIVAVKIKKNPAQATGNELQRLYKIYKKNIDSMNVSEISKKYGLDFLVELIMKLKDTENKNRFGEICFYVMEMLSLVDRYDEALKVAQLPKGKSLNRIDTEEILILLKSDRLDDAIPILEAHIKRRMQNQNGNLDDIWILLSAVIYFKSGKIKIAQKQVSSLIKNGKIGLAAFAKAFAVEEKIADRIDAVNQAIRYGGSNRDKVDKVLLSMLKNDRAMIETINKIEKTVSDIKDEMESLQNLIDSTKPLLGNNRLLEDESGGKSSIWKDSNDDEELDKVPGDIEKHHYRFAYEFVMDFKPDEYPVCSAANKDTVVVSTNFKRLFGYTLKSNRLNISWILSDYNVKIGHGLAFIGDDLFIACRSHGLRILRLSPHKTPVEMKSFAPTQKENPEHVFIDNSNGLLRIIALGSYCLEIYSGENAENITHRSNIYSDNAMKGAAFIGNHLAISHMNNGGVVFYDIGNLEKPKLLSAIRIKDNVSCGFIYSFGNVLLVNCNKVIWVLEKNNETIKHVTTLKLSFGSAESWPDIRYEDSQGKFKFIIADSDYGRAVTCLDFKNKFLKITDVLSFKKSNMKFETVCFLDDAKNIFGIFKQDNNYIMTNVVLNN